MEKVTEGRVGAILGHLIQSEPFAAFSKPTYFFSLGQSHLSAESDLILSLYWIQNNTDLFSTEPGFVCFAGRRFIWYLKLVIVPDHSLRLLTASKLTDPSLLFHSSSGTHHACSPLLHVGVGVAYLPGTYSAHGGHFWGIWWAPAL